MADFLEKRKEEIKALTDKLESGIQSFYSGDKYRAYLDTMAKFHRYSLVSGE